MKQPILSAQHVSVSRLGTELVHDVSVTLEEGKVLAIIGPNGAGKTTLMKALLGLMPHHGTVAWRAGVKIGYVPQKITISPSFPLTVEELFLTDQPGVFWKHFHHPELVAWLRRVDAEDAMHKRLAHLSGGELQRVLIAHALASDAHVICLDEPSAGIDIGGGKTIYGLLSELNKEHGRTIIIISHDLDVVFRYADQVLCIDKRMICVGRPQTVLTAETIEQMYGTHAGIYHHHDHA